MIRMTRLHLINWHNFQDDIIDFKNITYLLGVNAVGKTTIMDAIRYCLTTNKDFNTAGNKKSGRTLLGSVHQKQRAEDSYLRPGHTVSYIGIEFLDENINKKFVITVRVESETPKQDLKGVSQDWYITKPGYALEDIPFFTQVKDGKRPTSRDAFKLDNKGMDKASNQTDAKRRICRMLGIGDSESPIGKKFNEVFHMGTSLEDIKDIREFIYTYILPEPEVNIDFLRKDMQELERLQEILQEARDREILLDKINDKLAEARVRLSKVKVNEILVAYANYQGNIEDQHEHRHLISQWNSTIDVLNSKLAELSEQHQKSLQLLFEAQKAAQENKENKEIISLEQEVANKEGEREPLLQGTKKFRDISRKLQQLKKALIENSFSCEWLDIINDDSYSQDDRVEQINLAAKILGEMEDQVKDRDAEIRSHIFSLRDESKKLEDKIKSLEAGVLCYPNEAVLVKRLINEKLESLGKKSEARLLCEMLYMTDDSWQDAVESYLNTQRFNVIVAPENYLVAKQVFISLGDAVKGIGLIDTRKIGDLSYGRTDVSYLADKVDSENIYAKRYARFVMKEVICCDSSDDLEEYQKSVTRDRLRFQSYCLQRMAKKEHFIGVDAIEKQLETAKKNLVVLQEKLRKSEAEKLKFDVVSHDFHSFISGRNFEELLINCDAKRKLEEVEARIKELNQKIDEFKQNPIFLAMYNRVQECQKAEEALRIEMIKYTAQKQNLEESRTKSEHIIADLEATVNALQQIYEEKLSEYPELASDVDKKYREERQSKKPSTIVYNFGNQVNKDLISLNNYLNQELIPLQQQYISTYTCDYPTGLDGATRYQQEFLSLKNIELERHREQLIQAQIRCKDRFRKEVLFRMKDDILRARQQFKQINRVMENLEYGEESYRFGIDKSRDRELGLFYDIIMDKENHQIAQDNGTIDFFPKSENTAVFESQIDDFMSRIMSDVEEHAKQNLTGQKSSAKSMGTYVDYRTYLDYDIIVKNSVTGFEVPLSKVSGEGSGGESQAPFYVAICASLLQIYEQNPDGCMRLILLDEAFNNMTSDRIEPMMTMFKTLNLQLVLIATAEKASSIIPYCDITYAIVKSGNRNAIGEFNREW